MNRSSLAVKSSLMGIFSKFIITILNFICRFFFVRYIGIEILGLEGVIRDCVSLLSMTDLGISTAMTYRLYGLFNKKDYKTAGKYLSLYKFAYRCIMTAIAILGVFGSLFLKVVVTDVTLSWTYIYVVYFLQIAVVEASYMAAYKRCILNADQKYYIQIKYDTLVRAVSSVIRICVVFFLHNYILYIIVTFGQNLISNLILSYYVKKNYKEYETASHTSTREQKRTLFEDMKNIMGNKVCEFIYSSTDNILISTFLSTRLVGYLANYKLLFSTITTIMMSVTNPVTTLIGSYLNDSNVDNSYEVLRKYSFARYVIAVMFVVPVCALGQNFIVLYAGEEWLLSGVNLVLLSMDFYIAAIYGALGDFSAGLGIFSEQKKVSLAGAVLNISLSFLLLQVIGIEGVLIGTVVSQMVLWLGNWHIVYKKLWGEKEKIISYWIMQLRYFVVVVFALLTVKYMINSFIFAHPIVDFVIKGVLIEIVTAAIIVISNFRTQEFRYVVNIAVRFLKKRGA